MEKTIPPLIVGSVQISEEFIDKTQVVKLKTDIQEQRTPQRIPDNLNLKLETFSENGGTDGMSEVKNETGIVD